VKILQKVGAKRSASNLQGNETNGLKEQKKKQKDVYVVNKMKWYVTATARELETLPAMVFDGIDMDNKHRIVQHSIRLVYILLYSNWYFYL
jgi:hypothetical protein